MNNLSFLLALICAVIGGTVYITATDKHVALNTQAHQSHLASHVKQQKHDDEFRGWVRTALEKIKDQTAPVR